MRDGKLIFRTANRGALNLSIKLAAGSARVPSAYARTGGQGVCQATVSVSDVIILSMPMFVSAPSTAYGRVAY